MATSTTEYAAFNDAQPLPIHSESAGASLSLADANPQLEKSQHFQEAGILAAIISLTGLLALSAVVSASFVMFLEGTAFIYVCFAGPIVLAPVVVYQRSRMEKLSTFREVSNELREEINHFAAENDILSAEVNKLQRQMTRVTALEERFQQLCNRERRDAGKMRKLVKENAAVQNEIKVLQAADEIQALLAAILKADKDEDSFISEKELDEVMMRMKVFGGRKNGPDEEAIRKAFKAMITSQGVSLMRIHSALEKQRQREEEEKTMDGSKFNPIPVSESDIENNIVDRDINGTMSEEVNQQAARGCCA